MNETDRELYLQVSTEHFINQNNGFEFKVGQTIWLRPDFRIGEDTDIEKRTFVITKFWISDHDGCFSRYNGNKYGYVYAYIRRERFTHSIHLNNSITSEINPKFREYPKDRTERNQLIEEFRKEYLNFKKDVIINNYLIF